MLYGVGASASEATVSDRSYWKLVAVSMYAVAIQLVLWS